MVKFTSSHVRSKESTRDHKMGMLDSTFVDTVLNPSAFRATIEYWKIMGTWTPCSLDYITKMPALSYYLFYLEEKGGKYSALRWGMATSPQSFTAEPSTREPCNSLDVLRMLIFMATFLNTSKRDIDFPFVKHNGDDIADYFCGVPKKKEVTIRDVEHWRNEHYVGITERGLKHVFDMDLRFKFHMRLISPPDARQKFGAKVSEDIVDEGEYTKWLTVGKAAEFLLHNVYLGKKFELNMEEAMELDKRVAMFTKYTVFAGEKPQNFYGRCCPGSLTEEKFQERVSE